MSSFAAPEVAKPAAGQKSNVSLTPVAAAADDLARLRLSGQASSNQVTSLQELHHPAYRAQAPPVDPTLID
jgi:hypothetical protein